MPRASATLPAEPFVTWLKQRLAAARREDPDASALLVLSGQTGIAERWLRNYLKGLDTTGKPSPAYERRTVEDALDRAGWHVWDLYDDDIVDEDRDATERYCETCRDTVLVGADGICLWCESPTVQMGARRRAFCPACDGMLILARDGTCSACGNGCAAHMPWDPCACGCDQLLARFDRRGTRRRYLRGHGSAAPARHARQCPECAGPKSTHAQRCGVCARRRPSAPRVLMLRERLVQEAWRLHDSGGLTVADAAQRLLDRTAYKDTAVFRIALSREFARRGLQPRTGAPISDELLAQAFVLHSEQGLTLADVARALCGRTAHSTPESLEVALHRHFKRRGWKLRPRYRALTDEQVRAAAAEHQSGRGLRALGAELGVAAETLRREFTARGLPVRRASAPAPLSGERLATLAAEHLQGATVTELAARVGCHPGTLAARFRAAGHTIRRGPAPGGSYRRAA